MTMPESTNALEGISKRERQTMGRYCKAYGAAKICSEVQNKARRSAATTARERAPPAYSSHFLRLGERDFVRPSILQALALCSLDDFIGAGGIIHAQLRAI